VKQKNFYFFIQVKQAHWDKIADDCSLAANDNKICKTCRTAIGNDQVPLWSKTNNVFVEEAVTTSSVNMTLLERILVSTVHVFQTVVKLGTVTKKMPSSMLASALKGTAIYLPIPVNDTIQKVGDDFLRNLQIVVQRLPRRRTLARELVRLQVVREAIETYKSLNNPLYEGITLPEDIEEQINRAITVNFLLRNFTIFQQILYLSVFIFYR
jgi:hypothetical protein